MLYPVELRALYLAKSTVVAMKQCKTVQKVRSPAIEAQTIPQGADSFNQTSGTASTGCRIFQPAQGLDQHREDNLVRHKSGRYYARVFGHQRFLHAYRARRFVIESLPIAGPRAVRAPNRDAAALLPAAPLFASGNQRHWRH